MVVLPIEVENKKNKKYFTPVDSSACVAEELFLKRFQENDWDNDELENKVKSLQQQNSENKGVRVTSVHEEPKGYEDI